MRGKAAALGDREARVEVGQSDKCAVIRRKGDVDSGRGVSRALGMVFEG